MLHCRHAWHKRARPTPRERLDSQLAGKIREIHSASRETCGRPRVHAQLQRDGVEVGKEPVARLMQRAGIRSRVRRRFVVTTNSRHD